MSQTKEIEIENYARFAERNNPDAHATENEPEPTASKQINGTNGINGHVQSPTTPDFTKKSNGNHIEIKTSKTEPAGNNHKSSVTSPVRSQTKSIILEDVKNLKEKGDSLYNQKKYSEAFSQYKLSLNYVHYDPKLETDKLVINKGIYSKILSNIGQCLSKLEHVDEAIVYFNQVINLDQFNIKAYYRLAHLFNKKNDSDRAYETLKKGMTYLPDLQDAHLRKLYVDYYNHTVNMQNSQLDALKSRMKDYYANKPTAKPKTGSVLSKALVTSIAAGTLTSACLAYSKNNKMNTMMVAMPANLILWHLITSTQDRRKRYLALAGLLGINIAIWKFL